MSTLAELRTKVRQRADMERSTFISDSELTGYINNSYAELYDILVSRFEDYYSKKASFTLSNTNEYSIPSDLYKVRGIDFFVSPGDAISVRKYNFDERNKVNRNSSRLLRGWADRSYRLMGQKILIEPSGRADGNYTLWYIPRYTPLTNDNDQLSDVLDFEEYIIVDAAIKCLIKEESDTQVLLLIKQQLKGRIEAMASNRTTEPERVADVSGWTDVDFLYPRT